MAKIQSVDVVVVETPPVQVMTVMQAFVKSPYGGGLLPGLIADAEGKALVSPPAIPDIGLLVAQGLQMRPPQQASWFPKMSSAVGTVKADQATSGESLRVAVTQYEVAPAPLRTSGVTHGGEKIDVERLGKGDTSQLKVEVERAAQWLVNEIAGSIQ